MDGSLMQPLASGTSRRAVLRRGLGGGGLAALLALGWRADATGQEATPAATPAAGLTVEPLGSGMPAAAPGRELQLFRITFPAGFTLPAHTHPAGIVAHVESGAFGFTLISGENTHIIRGTAAGGAQEPVTPDVEVTLEAGDAIFHDEEVVAIDRALGDEPAVLLVAALLDPTAPLVQPAEATPAA